MPKKPIVFLAMTIGVLSLWSCAIKEEKKSLGIEHVIVIGVDGLSPDGIKTASTPNFDTIINQGAHTFHARAILPSSSSSNWSSMIMGAGPEQHGITSNAWEKDNFVLPAITQSEDFLFPTIFKLVDSQIENAEVGSIYHWGGFGRLFEKSAVDYDINGETEEVTAELASAYIKEKKPTFTFIHFDHVDHAGHEFGHGTEEYYKSVVKADELLGEVMNAIKDAGMVNNTLVIISADHGGMGKGHGGETLDEIEIPFILWGKSVKKGHKIKYPVYQYDNAATVAFVLGLKTPHAWIGKPAKMGFEGYDVSDNYPITEMLEQPTILPKAEFNKKAGGLFDDEASIQIENSNLEGNVHYTLDGTMPNSNSKKYTEPIQIDENVVLKAAIILDGKIRSTAVDAFFRVKPEKFLAPIDYKLYYLNNLTSVPNLDNRTPDVKGTCFEFTSDEIEDKIKGNTAVKFNSQLVIEKEGAYGFFTRSDDGSKLWIDGKEVVDNDGDHGVREKGGKIDLKPGVHDIEVIWFNGGGSGWLDVYYQSISVPKQIIPTTILK
ncbi:hypothetical protein GGR42_001804 [Saonia flava]|uniref:PA14 domain-containing protein n=1 Tax=Saonia flava TaxID=523696 RepID=A0A846QXK8_9FLAO|nr:alkaline phosphatase family protein [Saonia flava]NJB71342.1 hypothetical protein [Saonia flava]